MPLSRRGFLAGLGAAGWSGIARADTLPGPVCGPPEHQARIDRTWRHALSPIERETGFVNYTDEVFPFRFRIAPGVTFPTRTAWPTDDIPPSCAVATPNALARRGSLIDAILSPAPSETCQQLPGEPIATFERLATAVKTQVVDAIAADPRTVLIPVGSHHSCSGAYRPPTFDRAIAVDVGGINGVIPLDQVGPTGGTLVLCGAGISVCQLNETLWKLGLALPTMGSFDVQTLAGAVSTGTHGSARDIGALGDCVVAVIALCAPSKPGDAERWRFLQLQARETDAPKVALAEAIVASEDVFHAFVVSMGLLGIAVGMVIEARPPFYLYRRRYARRWREIRPEMARLVTEPPAGIRGRGWRYELYVNPVATRRFLSLPLDAPTPGSTGTPEWIVQEVQIDEWDHDLDYRPDVLRLDGANQLFAAAEEDIDIRPFRPSAMVTDQLFHEESGEFADRSYRVLRLEWTDSVRAWGTEWFVPLDHAADAVDWVLDRNLSLGYGHVDRLVHPFGVRFLRSRNGLLCPSRYGGDRYCCAIEPSQPVRGAAGANGRERDSIVRWSEAFQAESDRRGWEGRFHWGLINDPLDRAHLEAAYPDLPQWRDVFLVFDRFGRFDTTLARQLGLVAWRDENRDRATAYDVFA
ncbi:MAG: FAD-binding protein [Myxococcota bacterium]